MNESIYHVYANSGLPQRPLFQSIPQPTEPNPMKVTQYNDTIRHAIAYAEADRSDPFTFNRVMSHIASGICDDATESNGRLRDCRYKAERNVGQNGRVYYSNLQRP